MPEETENKFIYDLGGGQWNIPALRDLLEKVLPEDKAFSDLEIELELPNVGRRVMILNARKIYLEEPYFKTVLNMTEHFDQLILLAIEDITEHKKAEEAFHVSEKRYHSLFENMLNGFAYCEMLYEDGRPQDFIYLEVNSAFETLTGLKNVVGKKVSEVIPGIREAYPVLFEIYGRVALTGRPESFDIYLEPLATWLFISVYSTERGYFVAVFDNITERKRAESITQARLRMLSIIASPSASRDETLQMMLDEIEKETGSTIGFYHFLGVDQETLSLQAWSTNTLRVMCTAEGKGSHYNISQGGVWVDCVRERGPVIHNDYVALAHRKGLPPGHAEVRREMVVPILRDSRIVAIIGVGNKPTDYNAADVEIVQSLGQLSWEIFERIRAADELQTALAEVNLRTQELELAYKDMESFSYAASHDLRSPLITIEGFSKILLEDYAEKLDDNGKDLLNRVRHNAQKMNRMIRDLLAFSRISTKEVRKYEFNMEALVQKLVEELKPPPGERDIRFEIRQLPSAYGDLAMITQVLVNLLSNAIKFTQTRETAMIEVGGYTENGENVYYVQDNGMGFDMQFTDKIFGLFQRLHTPKEAEGTGIGLVIVKNIIEKHGGRVWAEGKPDEGAKFFFVLPGKAG